MDIEASGEVFEWRGPSPFHFVAVTGAAADDVRARAAAATYGWGMVPVECRLGATTFTTSLWPKGDAYYLPLKDSVRRSEGIAIGDHVTVAMRVRPR